MPTFAFIQLFAGLGNTLNTIFIPVLTLAGASGPATQSAHVEAAMAYRRAEGFSGSGPVVVDLFLHLINSGVSNCTVNWRVMTFGPFNSGLRLGSGHRRRAAVMRAVWSFWSKPFDVRHHRMWTSRRHHLLAWVLSFETARQHFETTALVTDDAGARMLVDQLGLPFDEVSTALNVLDDEDPLWWCLGKLYAYRMQTEPFVHIDSDCFLWQPLPRRMLTADVLAQSPEQFAWDGATYYRPELLEPLIQAERGWLPDELVWFMSQRGGSAVCCGIVGGNHLAFIRGYADRAIRIVEHPANQPIWRSLPDRISENLIIEQYLLGACIEFERSHDTGTLDVQYLFPSTDAAFEPGVAARAGFTHLIGLAKSDPELAQRLDARVKRDYPGYYQRCRALQETH